MQPISHSSTYAIRALTYLARHQADGLQAGQAVAKALGLPAPFLAKLLQPLVARGLLASQRGRRGGFRLAVDPDQVTLLDIVESQEPLWRGRRCLLGQEECSDERACPLHDYWKRASAEARAKLSATTLADILRFCDRSPRSGYPGRGARRARGRRSRRKPAR
jgi:Rrf2 family protein